MSTENITAQHKSTLIKVMDFTADKIAEMKQNIGVLGEKQEVDGITIIPVSKVSVGFAGGGADISDKQKGKFKNPAGTGGSITETPMVFLVIADGQVSLYKISDESRKSVTGDMISAVIAEIKQLIIETKNRKAKK